MPSSPDVSPSVYRQVVQVYADAELAMLRLVARYLAADLEAPDWAQRKLAQLQTLRRLAERDLGSLDSEAARAIADAVQRAYATGSAAAVADLRALGVDEVLPPARAMAVDRLALEAVSTITRTTPMILRSTMDAYRRAVADSIGGVLLGADTRRQSAQRVLDDLARDGIKGFTDRAGRRWSLTSYVEMATRTAAGQAQVAGHLDYLASSGVDLVLVSDAPRECPLCRPWEGKVLSQSGGVAGTIEVTSATSGSTVSVNVAGTVDQARAAGLLHPNCRHSLSAYLPGATRNVAAQPEPRGYEAQQHQRYLERGIRSWKRREAVALDDQAAAAARARIGRWQAAMRDHLAANPELKRQSAREQIGKAI
jgi:hypothetical protein